MTNAKKEMDFSKEYDIDSLYEVVHSCTDFENAVESFKKLKILESSRYSEYLEKMKVLFVLSDEFNYLSTAALIFGELKVHSAVPLIIAKLLSGKFDNNGGTFLYSLMSLRKKHFYTELELLWSRDISWEMKQKLVMMGIDEP